MQNPYLKLHKEFRAAGAEVLISSGQACVVFGIAAFSKDGDWIYAKARVPVRPCLRFWADMTPCIVWGLPWRLTGCVSA